ncbi:MAG: hypothetical protein AB1331_10040 [Bacillota bacterium]
MGTHQSRWAFPGFSWLIISVRYPYGGAYIIAALTTVVIGALVGGVAGLGQGAIAAAGSAALGVWLVATMVFGRELLAGWT